MNISFAIWVGLGAALGIWRVVRSAPQQQAEAWANLSLIILSASLVGARLSYVWMNWDYFSTHLIDIPQIWLGGLSWPGAVAGVWLSILTLAFVYQAPSDRATQQQGARTAISRLPLAWLGDRLYPILPPVAITTWLATWQAGIAYGNPVPPGTWWGMPALDETGRYNPHFPLQLLAALALLADFCLLEMRVKPMRPPGRLSGYAFLHLLLNLLVISALRADPGPQWYGLRADVWIAAALLVLYLLVIAVLRLISLAGKKQSLAGLEQTRS